MQSEYEMQSDVPETSAIFLIVWNKLVFN